MDDGGPFVASAVQVIQGICDFLRSIQQLRVGEGRTTKNPLCQARLHLVLRQQRVQRAASQILQHNEAAR